MSADSAAMQNEMETPIFAALGVGVVSGSAPIA